MINDKVMDSQLHYILTFPKTGAIPIITEAKAERTCWEESDDSSWKISENTTIKRNIRQKMQSIKQNQMTEMIELAHVILRLKPLELS